MNAFRLPAGLLGSLLLLASTSCKHCDEPEPEQLQPEVYNVSYAQTQCADKWGQARTPQQLETVAIAYLAQQGITLTFPKATQTGPAAGCSACTCPTGVVLVGQIHVSQLAAIQALGFTKL